MVFSVFPDQIGIIVGIAVAAKMAAGMIRPNVITQKAGALRSFGGLLRNAQMSFSGFLISGNGHTTVAIHSKSFQFPSFRTTPSKQKKRSTLRYFVFRYCWWPDLNRHGVATEGF